MSAFTHRCSVRGIKTVLDTSHQAAWHWPWHGIDYFPIKAHSVCGVLVLTLHISTFYVLTESLTQQQIGNNRQENLFHLPLLFCKNWNCKTPKGLVWKRPQVTFYSILLQNCFSSLVCLRQPAAYCWEKCADNQAGVLRGSKVVWKSELTNIRQKCVQVKWIEFKLGK